MDGGCGGGACGGGGGRRGGGSADYRHTLRTGLVVNAVMGVLLLTAGGQTRATVLLAVALLFLNHAATYGVTLGTMGRSLESRARLSLAQGVALTGAAAWVMVAAGRSLTGEGLPDAPLASLALLLALGVTLSVATLLFAGRRGKLTLRAVWLCARGDALPQAAALMGMAGVWVLGRGWPDAAVAALVAVLTLPDAWSLVRSSIGPMLDRPRAPTPR